MDKIIHIPIDKVLSTVGLYASMISVSPGKGKGIVETGSQPSFEDKVKEFDAQIATGKMQQRDWKCRYDGHKQRYWEGYQTFNVNIAPTSWGEWREDYNRSEEEAMALQNLGESKHNDRGFYLSNGLGAAVLTLTREGNVVVGIRKSDSYDGAIHGAAGWMTFDKDASKINPVNDAYRELGEELAVKPNEVSALHLVGLVAYPKTLEADFVFVAKTVKENEYFTSGAWKEAVDAREHRDLVILNNPGEIRRLVDEGRTPVGDKKYEVLASTGYGLSALAEHWSNLQNEPMGV